MRKIIFTLMFVAVLVFAAGCEECPFPLDSSDCPDIVNEVCINGMKETTTTHQRYAGDASQGTNTCESDNTKPPETSSVPDSSCPETPPQKTCNGQRQTCTQPGQNPGVSPNRASAAMGHSPLDFKPLLLNLPFPPLSIPATASACDSTEDANFFIAAPVKQVVFRYHTCSKTLSQIPVSGTPLQVAITPDTKLALVTTLTNSVAVIDTASSAVASTITVGDDTVSTVGVAITPDGTRAYVTNFVANNAVVYAIDLSTHNIVATIPVGAYPLSAFVTPDGSLVYVTCPFQNGIYVIDTLSNTVAATIDGIFQPYGVAFNPSGTLAYVTSGASPGTVKVVDTTTYKVVKSYSVDNQPVDVQIDPTSSGRFVVVLNYGSGSRSQIDTVTGKVTTTSTGGVQPSGLVFVH